MWPLPLQVGRFLIRLRDKYHPSVYSTSTIVGLHLALVVMCFVPDWLLWSRPIRLPPFCYALLDNITHATIAMATWLLAFEVLTKQGRDTNPLFSIWGIDVDIWAIGCFLLGSLIDADHFLAAGSIRLKDATSLTARPFGHNLSLWLVVAGCLYIVCSQLELGNVGRNAASLTLVASWTHLLRDSWRRGLWIWPLGTTSSLPYWVYLLLECLTPLFFTLFSVNNTNSIRLERRDIQMQPGANEYGLLEV